MNFYDTAFLCLISGCGVLSWRQYSRQEKREEKLPMLDATTPRAKAEASAFTRLFLTVYCLVMASDWLQGPYVYSLYKDQFGLSETVVAALFTTGFLSGGISGYFVGQFADKYGRKTACLVFCTTYSMACFSTLVPNIFALFLGRVFGGLSTSLMYSAFESWMVTEYHKKHLEQVGKSLSSMFGIMTTLNSIVAILSGVFSEWLVQFTQTKRAPFMASAALLLLAFWIIWGFWSENYGDSGDKEQSEVPAQSIVKLVITDHCILALGLASCFFEGSMYLFVFFWTPALKAAHGAKPRDLPLGMIFACFMGSVMLGSLAFNLLVSKYQLISHSRLLTIIFSTASSTLLIPVIVKDEAIIFWAFCIFEACVGMYWPSVGYLKGRFIDDGVRARVYGMLRIPLNIFVVVALSLIKEAGQKPPMTSTRAKKEYAKANRGPRVSRAEQRRRDQEELVRHRKEYEKIRAAEKAKNARDKKSEKVAKEKEERKRRGLPEPSRFVRASQPTISRFITSGKKRGWQELDNVTEDSDATIDDEVNRKNIVEPLAKRIAIAAEESEDEFGGFPSLSQSDLPEILEKIDSSIKPIDNSSAIQLDSATPDHDSQELPKLRRNDGKKQYFDYSAADQKLVENQLLSEAAEAVSKSDHIEPPGANTIDVRTVKKRTQETRTVGLQTPKNMSKPCIQSSTVVEQISRPSLQERAINMPPPPRRPSKAISFAPDPTISRSIPHTVSRVNSVFSLPPSSAQAFLENNLDDFFPSPTQQIRELMDDVDDLPSNTQIAKELDAPEPKKVFQKAIQEKVQEEEFYDFISTQDLMSSQEMLEIGTPSRKSSNLHNLAMPPQLEPTAVLEDFMELICSQDLTMSSQDIREMDTPKAAVLSKPDPVKPVQQKRERTSMPRFFEEKEDDLLHAALHESQLLAAREEKVSMEEKIKEEGGAKGKDRKDGTVRGRKSKLQRTKSLATDYGDDDFSGCEEELFALC
ncbi:hypothetical protein B7494_g1369 [Chlorociboria aeruginascens]|nr:hypothetical protein B7494_g1369 [Chlorociboria aeruginascens]